MQIIKTIAIYYVCFYYKTCASQIYYLLIFLVSYQWYLYFYMLEFLKLDIFFNLKNCQRQLLIAKVKEQQLYNKIVNVFWHCI